MNTAVSFNRDIGLNLMRHRSCLKISYNDFTAYISILFVHICQSERRSIYTCSKNPPNYEHIRGYCLIYQKGKETNQSESQGYDLQFSSILFQYMLYSNLQKIDFKNSIIMRLLFLLLGIIFVY